MFIISQTFWTFIFCRKKKKMCSFLKRILKQLAQQHKTYSQYLLYNFAPNRETSVLQTAEDYLCSNSNTELSFRHRYLPHQRCNQEANTYTVYEYHPK